MTSMHQMTWTATPVGYSVRDMGSLIGSAEPVEDLDGFLVEHRFTGFRAICGTLGEAADWLARVEDSTTASLAYV